MDSILRVAVVNFQNTPEKGPKLNFKTQPTAKTKKKYQNKRKQNCTKGKGFDGGEFAKEAAHDTRAQRCRGCGDRWHTCGTLRHVLFDCPRLDTIDKSHSVMNLKGRPHLSPQGISLNHCVTYIGEVLAVWRSTAKYHRLPDIAPSVVTSHGTLEEMEKGCHNEFRACWRRLDRFRSSGERSD